jgi:hypothetical protein
MGEGVACFPSKGNRVCGCSYRRDDDAHLFILRDLHEVAHNNELLFIVMGDPILSTKPGICAGAWWESGTIRAHRPSRLPATQEHTDIETAFRVRVS